MYKHDIKKKTRYLLNYFENILENDFCDVLYDSEIDPQFSAVTAVNNLICYIDVLKWYGEKLKFNSIEEFFSYYSYTDDDYKKIMKRYSNEIKYYVGEIYYVQSEKGTEQSGLQSEKSDNTGDGSV